MNATRALELAGSIHAQVEGLSGEVFLEIYREDQWDTKDWFHDAEVSLQLSQSSNGVDECDLLIDPHCWSIGDVIALLPVESRIVTLSAPVTSSGYDICWLLADTLDGLLESVPLRFSVVESIKDLAIELQRDREEFTVEVLFGEKRAEFGAVTFLFAYFDDLRREIEAAIEESKVAIEVANSVGDAI